LKVDATSEPTRSTGHRVFMTTATPSVSVVMATCNGERWIESQLRSVLAQFRAGDEVVIVDDASTDATCDVIAALGDSRVRLARNPVNLGAFASFERALRDARAGVIFMSDQDDLWLPGKRDALVSALDSSDAALLALSDAQVIDADGVITHDSFMRTRGGFKGGLLDTLAKNRFLGCAMAFRRELLAHVLPIPRGVPMHDMWIGALAACKGKVVYVDRPLMQYRRHGSNLSPSVPQSFARRLAWRVQLLRLVLMRLARGPSAVPYRR
jgi:glycosyltransferase involved in cell wall biosynthesis